MYFLRRLKIFFLATLSQLDRYPRRIHREEETTRFLFSKDSFSTKAGKVKPEAFFPPKSPRSISIYRIRGLYEKQIWRIGRLFVEGLRRDRRSIKARADLPAHCYLEQKLTIRPLRLPHPRHAEVVDWPEGKSAQWMFATALANESRLVVQHTSK